MGHHNEAFIGIDTSKLRNAAAVAEAGREGEVRYLGEIDTSEAATRKLVAGLAGTKLEAATCGTIRLKLLKIGALVTISVRRVKLAFASACPDREVFVLAARRL